MSYITEPGNTYNIILWSDVDAQITDDLRDKTKEHYLNLIKSKNPLDVIVLRRLEKDIKQNLRIIGRVDKDKITVVCDLQKHRLMRYGILAKNGKKIYSAPYSNINDLEVWDKLIPSDRCFLYINRYVDFDDRGFPYVFFLPDYEKFIIPAIYQIEHGYIIKRFIILTHDSSGDIGSLVKQMPIVLPEKYANDWLQYGEIVFSNAITTLEYHTINLKKI